MRLTLGANPKKLFAAVAYPRVEHLKGASLR